MRILIDNFHPASVHFFKNFIWRMQGRGHQVLVATKDKDVAMKLLDAYGFTYVKTGKYSKNLLLKGLQMLKIDWDLYRIARDFKPDILVGQGAINASHVSKLIGKPCIVFADDAYSLFFYRPFADVICTFGSFVKDIGEKQIRIDSYKELAYLHPRYFKPDPSVLDSLGLKSDSKFVIIRFVGWQASHDVGRHGFNVSTKQQLVKELGKYARVFISSEKKPPAELEEYKILLPPEKLHDLLYYATLCVVDGQTMATESAVLGTPAVRCNSFVSPKDFAGMIEMEKKYDLIYSFRDAAQAIQRAVELLKRPGVKQEWAGKREGFLAEKADITEFMVDFIENYPASLESYQREKESINL
ncbi:DUF354 domain-containing protein [Chloroflexota bacterium]